MRNPVPQPIAAIRPGSLAEEAGIEPGDRLLTVAGRAMRDAVDLQFHQAEPEVEVRIQRRDGREDLIIFEKDIDEDLGLEFERPTWDAVDLCNNNCFFCFLKGLPKGMRKTLYMKDDDYRLSFLHGNFVTLTNLEDDDWERLAEQRLSPLNVSVHATEPALRRKMLGNASAPDIVEQLRRLGELGIRAHTQIVLCPGVNDSAALDRSLSDLVALYPTVQTVSVVPVGASPKLEDWSASRDGIELVRPTAAFAASVVDQVAPIQRACRQSLGATVVHCSDEYYVTSGRAIPTARNYDGFPQFENGIGMVRRLLDDWARTKKRLERRPLAAHGKRLIIACGSLIAPILGRLAAEATGYTGATIDVVAVENHVFGERVNVSGLLCGADIATSLDGRRADCFVLPRACLDYFGEKFLDDLTPVELEARLGAPVAFAGRMSEVIRVLADGASRPSRNEAPNGAFWSR
jgi:putative radical SAM enzyme (TIGR03279 family)